MEKKLDTFPGLYTESKVGKPCNDGKDLCSPLTILTLLNGLGRVEVRLGSRPATRILPKELYSPLRLARFLLKFSQLVLVPLSWWLEKLL